MKFILLFFLGYKIRVYLMRVQWVWLLLMKFDSAR